MGRGLSPLQRYIVAKAATVERLHYYVILHEYYGWSFHRRPGRLLWPDRHAYRVGDGEYGYYTASGKKFRPQQLGRKTYHKTMVSLSRAVARLARRGLVTWLVGTRYKWSGVEITPAGKRLADTLTVDMKLNCATSQPIDHP
jgi:hypothetical protein